MIVSIFIIIADIYNIYIIYNTIQIFEKLLSILK